MEDTKRKILETLGKPGLVAVSAYAGSKLFMEAAQVNLMGMDIDAAVLMGLTCGAASLIETSTKNWVVPIIDKTGLGETAINLASPAVNGAASVALVYLINGMEINYAGAVSSFAIGAGSEVAASYVQNALAPAMITKRR